jgi:hypothetical protein
MMFRWLWRLIGRGDNSIDKLVDRIIYRLETDPAEMFTKRLTGLSNRTFNAIILAVKEQLKSEEAPERLAQLKRLDTRLAVEADRRSGRKRSVA